MLELDTEFRRIRDAHWKAEQRFFARAVLGPSVIRVFNEGTREPLFATLARIRLHKLDRIRSESSFRVFFLSQLSKVANVIRATNPQKRNGRIYPGYKWGHATKVLSLFLRDIVVHSHFFRPSTAKRLSHFLYVPIDKVVITRLRELRIKPLPKRIKDIESAEKFFQLQGVLRVSANRAGVPPVWFDDNWGLRELTSNRPLHGTRRKRRAREQ